MDIIAAILETPDAAMRLTRVTLPDPDVDQVVVRVRSCGICHTDIGVQSHIALPAVLGHEGAGIVERCGDNVTHVAPGDPVSLTFGSCGACRNCRSDQPSHCYDALKINFFDGAEQPNSALTLSDGSRVNGAFFQQSSFATHALASKRNVVRMPADARLEVVGPLGCSLQTGAGAVANVFLAQPGSSIVCFGLGAVGQSAVMMANHLGCDRIIGVDPIPGRRELARSFGATHVFDAGEAAVRETLRITAGGADFCLDSAGTVETFHGSLKSVRCGGHVGVAAVPGWGTGFTFDPQDLAAGRMVTGILEGSSNPAQFIPFLYGLFEDGEMPFDRMLTLYPFENINEAVADLRAGDVVKPVLQMPEEIPRKL